MRESESKARSIVANDTDMLCKAEKHIEELNEKLKEKECELNFFIKQCEFYKQALHNLITFK